MLAVAPVFDKLGILMTSQVKQVLPAREIKTKNGAIEYLAMIEMLFTVIDADNPEDKIELSWICEGSDQRDKGIAKAITAGQRQIVQQLLMLASGDDPEADVQADLLMKERQKEVAAEEAEKAAAEAEKNALRKKLGPKLRSVISDWAEENDVLAPTESVLVEEWAFRHGVQLDEDGKITPDGWKTVEQLIGGSQ
jgi:hypothetical protein